MGAGLQFDHHGHSVEPIHPSVGDQPTGKCNTIAVNQTCCFTFCIWTLDTGKRRRRTRGRCAVPDRLNLKLSSCEKRPKEKLKMMTRRQIWKPTTATTTMQERQRYGSIMCSSGAAEVRLLWSDAATKCLVCLPSVLSVLFFFSPLFQTAAARRNRKWATFPRAGTIQFGAVIGDAAPPMNASVVGRASALRCTQS